VAGLKKKEDVMNILDRLKEPSTYAGLSGLMIAIGLSQEQWSMISTVLAGVAGLAAMFLKDRD
jgi:hypothetical protein|tara:strand:- start:399 stop:587 length:189 start_codon:yes stop_codon:yes gene_type:complete